MTREKHSKGAGKRKKQRAKKSASPAITRAPMGLVTSDSPPSVLATRRAAEKTMADIRRLIEEKEFSSIEEMNEFIKGLIASGGGRIPDVAPRTDLERAQDVMYEAWDTASRKKRVDLAKYALEISPDCADAYVLLATETARGLREEAELFEQGVRAGERALGRESFEEEAGHFWGLIETRPYMRAREGLASTLWALGERSSAIEHAREMLILNPNDNQGVRDFLLEWLLAEGKDEEAGALLKRYEKDPSAVWLYGRALHGFRTMGKSGKSDRLLRDAIERNPGVPAYLLREKKLPAESPRLVELGGESEAVEYAESFYWLWYYTPGALEWVRGVRGE